jgi:hypothetical protein
VEDPTHKPSQISSFTCLATWVKTLLEVKPATGSVADLLADIDKLSWFCGDPAFYYCGILLVFGLDQEFQRVRERVAAAIRALLSPASYSLSIWV